MNTLHKITRTHAPLVGVATANTLPLRSKHAVGSPAHSAPVPAHASSWPVAWQLGVRRSHKRNVPSRDVERNQSVRGFIASDVTGPVWPLKKRIIYGSEREMAGGGEDMRGY